MNHYLLRAFTDPQQKGLAEDKTTDSELRNEQFECFTNLIFSLSAEVDALESILVSRDFCTTNDLNEAVLQARKRYEEVSILELRYGPAGEEIRSVLAKAERRAKERKEPEPEPDDSQMR